jgi:hypothetical protein
MVLPSERGQKQAKYHGDRRPFEWDLISRNAAQVMERTSHEQRDACEI